jgi:non-ribosomal peptide synthetase component F
LCLDDPSVVSAIQSCTDSAVPADVTAALDSSQLIYIIYTSGTQALARFQAPCCCCYAPSLLTVRHLGSTGKPKGVRICHRGLVNQFQYIRSQPGMHEGDVILGVRCVKS